MVAVDVVVEHAEPFALEGWEAHEAEGISEGAVKTVFDEIPSKGSDGGGEAFGGFVASPAGRDGGDGTGLEKEELVGGEAPLDVLGECVVGVDAVGEVGESRELLGSEGGRGGLFGS